MQSAKRTLVAKTAKLRDKLRGSGQYEHTHTTSTKSDVKLFTMSVDEMDPSRSYENGPNDTTTSPRPREIRKAIRNSSNDD